MDRPLSSLSDGEEGLARFSSLVDNTYHLGREADRKVRMHIDSLLATSLS